MAKKPPTVSVGRPVAILCVIAVAIFAVAGLSWWRHIYNDPQRAFWSMLSNSLSTASVTRQINEATQDGTQQQVTRLSLGGQSTAVAATTIQQTTPNGTNTVKTETIGTPSADYARYISIDTKQRNQSNQPLDFSHVLGIWGKNDAAAADSQTGARFLSGSILSVIPFAPLNQAQRQQVLQTIRDQKVYDIDYNQVERRRQGSRSVFVYKVNVGASAYVTMLKSLAKQLGMKELDGVDPATYAQSAPEVLTVTVDKLSRHLLAIDYGGLRQETYSGYGLQSVVNIPKQTISITQLQSRLQTLQ